MREHCLAIRGTGLASLLELDNVPTNDPASAHLDDIHGSDGLPTSFQDHGTQVGEHGRLGGLQHGIKATENRHRQDHIAVFAANEDIAQAVVGDVPDETGDPVELGLVHGKMISV